MKFRSLETPRKFKIYTDGNIDKRVYDGDKPPEGFHPGSHYTRVAWNKGLTADTDERVKANGQATRETRLKNNNYQAWNKGLSATQDARVAKNTQNAKATVKARYGVDNITQHRVIQPGYQVWNKGLTKEIDARVQKASTNHKGVTAWNKGISIPGHPHSAETREKISKTHSDPDFQQRRYATMKDNGTLFIKDSKTEQDYLHYLKTIYPENAIIRQYFDRERYPFKCDFYIPSEDLFIEVHANWTHGKRPYIKDDPECQKQLELWRERAKTSKYYENAIYTWTVLDVRKAETAKKNNLNFQVIYY